MTPGLELEGLGRVEVAISGEVTAGPEKPEAARGRRGRVRERAENLAADSKCLWEGETAPRDRGREVTRPAP